MSELIVLWMAKVKLNWISIINNVHHAPFNRPFIKLLRGLLSSRWPCERYLFSLVQKFGVHQTDKNWKNTYKGGPPVDRYK